MFSSRVALLHEQHYRFSHYLENVYMSPSYMAQLVTPQSHFSSWFYSILVVEFDTTVGHHVTFEYPKGLVTADEQKRFLHLCLPDSRSMNRSDIFSSRNFTSKKKSGWLGFRFKKAPNIGFKNTSSSSSSFVHGASFFQTEKNSSYDRGARQKCVVLLSFLPIKFFYPLLLPVVLYVGYFYLLLGKKIILEACTYIEATWPKCPSWNERSVTLVLRTSRTKPIVLFCATHRSDGGTSSWSFMGVDSRETFGHLRRIKHTQQKHLSISLKSFFIKLGPLKFTPKSILYFWNLMQKTPWCHTAFLGSYHKIFFSGLKKKKKLLRGTINNAEAEYLPIYNSFSKKAKHVSKLRLLLKSSSGGEIYKRNNKSFVTLSKKQNIVVSYPVMFKNNIGKCCFMNTLIHYPIKCFFETFSWPSTSLVLSLENLSHSIWDLWEIALTESPFLVISANPMTSCSIVLNLIRLISPLEYVADVRPHINSYDEDLEYYQETLGKKRNPGSETPGVLLGSTDPSLLQRLLWCPNIMVANVQKDLCSSLGFKNRELFSVMHNSHLKSHVINEKLIKNISFLKKNNLSSLLHSFKKKVSKPIINTNPENMSTNLLQPSSEFHFFKFSKHTLNKDSILDKKISAFLCKTFPENLSHLKESIDKIKTVEEAFALDVQIFSHFEHLTQTLLYAFREFIQPDLKILMLNPLIKTPKPKPFTPSMFLKNLEKVNPALQGLYLAFGRSATDLLYSRFIKTQTFRRWLSTQIMREEQRTPLLQLKYCAAVKLSSLKPKLTVSIATEGYIFWTSASLLHHDIN
ncbi:uncharacterized protein LOC128883565 isoform X2 [Hylaeus volcanicus]|uniref:uncharacterized protein LOC128883565 isoform X2 n=1 Tax=Hylaeus volcanicus TaxID=313075 RepID=UPI0023B7CB32|nr:uncharacterized protein LOC128883565 isoform X2 [Hylaeus volcanicus]